MSIKEVIDDLKEQGFKVYGPDPLTTYVWFTDDGKRIGYAQYGPMEGVKYYSVHKTDTYIGTGFSAKDAEDALRVVPRWATGMGYSMPAKYDSMEAFIKNHWQPLVQY